LFENSPVSLWGGGFFGGEAPDRSAQAAGCYRFRAFFASHPDVLLECVHEIKVLDVNAATLALTHATDKARLIGNLGQAVRIDPLICG